MTPAWTFTRVSWRGAVLNPLFVRQGLGGSVMGPGGNPGGGPMMQGPGGPGMTGGHGGYMGQPGYAEPNKGYVNQGMYNRQGGGYAGGPGGYPGRWVSSWFPFLPPLSVTQVRFVSMSFIRSERPSEQIQLLSWSGQRCHMTSHDFLFLTRKTHLLLSHQRSKDCY